MKKNVKTLIVVGVAAVLLVGIMLLLIFLPNGDSDSTATYDEGIDMSASVDEDGVHQIKINTNEKGEIENNSYGTLIEYVPAEISTIQVENKSGSFEIESETPTDEDGNTEATVYTIKGFEDFDLQTGTPDAIANAAAQLDFSKVVSMDKSRAADFGFDDPRATITVTYTDKTKAVFIMGDDAPQNGGTYMKFGDGDAVYLVDTDTVSCFEYGITDMISLDINESASNDDNSQASSITISGSNFSRTIELVPNTSSKNSASYLMKEPTECYANESETSLVEGAVRGLYATGVKMVNPSDNQLSELGLAKPYAQIKAVYPDTTVGLLASKPDSSGNVYLMEKGGKVVYTIAADTVPWVTTSYEALLSEYVLNPKIASLSKMTVNDGSKTYDFSLSSKEVTTTDDEGSETTTTQTTVKYGDKELELAYFSTFFQNNSLVKLADTKSGKTSGKPIYSVSYQYSSDGTTDRVEFYSTGENRYLAVLNGNAVGHVHESTVNKLIDQVSQVAQGKTVDSLNG